MIRTTGNELGWDMLTICMTMVRIERDSNHEKQLSDVFHDARRREAGS